MTGAFRVDIQLHFEHVHFHVHFPFTLYLQGFPDLKVDKVDKVDFFLNKNKIYIEENSSSIRASGYWPKRIEDNSTDFPEKHAHLSTLSTLETQVVDTLRVTRVDIESP